jgi:hypothetical protein
MNGKRKQIATNVLQFCGEWQEQSEWCWAAASASVSSYYFQRGNGKRYRQCEIVQSLLFPDRNCCGNPSICNAQGPLDKGMKLIDHFSHLTSGAVGLGTIRAEIDAQRPISVRVILQSGLEHIVLIYGYSENSQLCVWNPAIGNILTDMNNWVAHVGWWQNTCLTKES